MLCAPGVDWGETGCSGFQRAWGAALTALSVWDDEVIVLILYAVISISGQAVTDHVCRPIEWS